MAELLLRITPYGLIKQQYILQDMQAIKDVLSIEYFLQPSDVKKLKLVMQHNQLEQIVDPMIINNQEHFLYLYQLGSQYLLYITPSLHPSCKQAIINLIHTFAELYMSPKNIDREEHLFLFESIQKLNNDLINKQRETAKLNQELNRLNNILNNRLVKDPLTNLVSRYQYRDEILLLIKENPDTYGLFWFIDIDNFKSINDTYGHKAGDQYLIEFAKRLELLSFKHTIKMRIAGDEFGLFIANVEDISDEHIAQYYQEFKDTVIHPVTIDGHTTELNCSVGIAIYNKDTNDLHVLIDYADYAMYQAKQAGKNQYKLFDKSTYQKEPI